MDQAGRSSQIIIDAANFVIEWVNEQTSQQSKTKELPFRSQNIIPVPFDDPQPEANPSPEGKGLEIHIPDDVYHTVELIGEKAIALLKNNPSHNAAILVREHRQGRFCLYRHHRTAGSTG